MNYYIGSMVFSDNDICHYGVKGMKWGVRRYEYDGAKGLRQRHAVRVASRLQQVNMDQKRIDRMTNRQKQSLKNATEYWDARARGKKPTKKRGLIKRGYDSYRSDSFKRRATYAGIGAAGVTAYAAVGNGFLKKFTNGLIDFSGGGAGIARVAVNQMSTNAIMLGQDAVLSILFGHF